MKRSAFKPRSKNVLIDVPDDGLPVEEIKGHTREKLFTLGYYLEEFTGAMHKKWPELAYVDLFAGPGRSRFESGEIVEGSPLIAARTEPPFTKLILIDEDPTNCDALRTRLARDARTRNAVVLQGNCNDLVDDVLKALPDPRKGLLTFCFADPYKLNIHFETIRKLSHLWIDFLVLIADQMAGSRDATLLEPANSTIDHFLDEPRWRERWASEESRGVKFRDFLFDGFTANMEALKFKSGTPLRVKVQGMGVALYRLGFYSKNQKGIDFWENARKRAPTQSTLF